MFLNNFHNDFNSYIGNPKPLRYTTSGSVLYQKTSAPSLDCVWGLSYLKEWYSLTEMTLGEPILLHIHFIDHTELGAEESRFYVIFKVNP